MDFVDWLKKELDDRGWKQAELARRAKLHRGTIANIMTGSRSPGPEFCTALADALGYPVEDVFRRAGLLPPDPSPAERKTLGQMIELAKMLTPAQRAEAISFLRFLIQRGDLKTGENTQGGNPERSRE